MAEGPLARDEVVRLAHEALERLSGLTGRLPGDMPPQVAYGLGQAQATLAHTLLLATPPVPPVADTPPPPPVQGSTAAVSTLQTAGTRQPRSIDPGAAPGEDC